MLLRYTLVPSTVIFSFLAILFFIAVCRDGLEEPPEEPPEPVVQQQDPILKPGFNTADLDNWQRRPAIYSKQPDAGDLYPDSASNPDHHVRIAIASMPFGESVHSVYDEAIEVLEKYAQRHGYQTYLLRQGITSNCVGLPVDCNSVDRKNLGGAWNKMLHLLNTITTELAKPEGDRLEWIMWQAADATLIINPFLPLSIFLPPPNHPRTPHTFLLATRDHNGLNNGVFFLRVHENSLKFLIAMLSMPLWTPHLDLGWYYEQGAMATLSERSPWKEGIVWQPKHWWNTYDFEVKRGSFLMHMPGQTDEVRVPKMNEWLGKIQGEKKWAVEVEELGLRKEIEEFWKRLEEKGTKEAQEKMVGDRKKEGENRRKEAEKKTAERGKKEMEEKKVSKGTDEAQMKTFEEWLKEERLKTKPESHSHDSA